MKFFESLLKFEVVNEASKFSFNSENELDRYLPMRSSCNYYMTIEVYTKFKNLNQSKFDNLHEFISYVSSMDIIAITEISQKRKFFLPQMYPLMNIRNFILPQIL